MARFSIRPRRVWGLWLLVSLAIGLPADVSSAQQAERAAWMREAKWGVMTHYLADWIARREGGRPSVERWNELVDNFDVERLAEQLESVGAGYYLMTIGQNSGYYLSPNATYDGYVGREPTRLSRRDLIADLHAELSKRDIRLMVYLPSGAPGGDREANRALEWRNGAHPNREFQRKWESVIREWSERWGDKVVGWWFDGCYWPNTMYRGDEPPNFESFAAAARAGNPNSAVGFNPGVYPRLHPITPHDDYTAGELSDPSRLEIRRDNDGKIDGAQIHMLCYLGRTWGGGEPRFSADDVIGWSRTVWGRGGAVTWDVPLESDGTIAEPFVAQLRAIGRASNEGQE